MAISPLFAMRIFPFTIIRFSSFYERENIGTNCAIYTHQKVIITRQIQLLKWIKFNSHFVDLADRKRGEIFKSSWVPIHACKLMILLVFIDVSKRDLRSLPLSASVSIIITKRGWKFERTIHPLFEILKALSILTLVSTVNFFLDFMPFFPYPCWKTINNKWNFCFNKIYFFTDDICMEKDQESPSDPSDQQPSKNIISRLMDILGLGRSPDTTDDLEMEIQELLE